LWEGQQPRASIARKAANAEKGVRRGCEEVK
jgi:hypothetical protein